MIFPQEQLIRIAISVIILVVLVTILVAVTSVFFTQMHDDATAQNSFRAFMNVISAQDSNEWRTHTFIHLKPGYAIVGFDTEATADPFIPAIQTVQQGTHRQQSLFGIMRPRDCTGACFCLVRLGENIGEATSLGCESTRFDRIRGQQWSIVPDQLGELRFLRRGGSLRNMYLSPDEQNTFMNGVLILPEREGGEDDTIRPCMLFELRAVEQGDDKLLLVTHVGCEKNDALSDQGLLVS